MLDSVYLKINQLKAHMKTMQSNELYRVFKEFKQSDFENKNRATPEVIYSEVIFEFRANAWSASANIHLH